MADHTAGMSDQALVWKFAFGTLVLLFCTVAWVGRKEAQPRTVEPPAAPLRTAPAPAPLVAASMPAPTRQPAPADLPEARDTPVRIRIALVEPPHPQRAAVVKVHRPVMRAVAKAHAVRARHAHVARKRPPHVSPYAAGQPHYPFDPRERWRSREG